MYQIVNRNQNIALLNITFVSKQRIIMNKKKIAPTAQRKSLRENRHFFNLNDDENRALNRYIKKYKIENKSKFFRETIIIAILKKFEEDHPTLFD